MSNALEFEPIYEEFFPKIVQYLARLTGKHEAEDLAQEVFVKVSKGLKDFRGESKLSTWLYRIATNTAADRQRSIFSRKISGDAGAACASHKNGEEANGLFDEKSPSAERQLIREEMSACIQDVVDRLPQSYRAVIILNELKEFKNSEIAEILGLSLATVKIRLHRARALLRKNLSEQCCLFRDEENELACIPKSTAPIR